MSKESSMIVEIKAIGAGVENDRIMDHFIQALRGMGNIEKIEAAKVGAILSINAVVNTEAVTIEEEIINVERDISRGARADVSKRFRL
jgi:hypothetical protein